MARNQLLWQSKLVLLLVVPFAAVSAVLQAHEWAVNFWPVTVWTLGVSLLFALAVLALGAATPGAAFAGAAITAWLMFSTTVFTPTAFTPSLALHYAPWRTALVPVLALFALADLATRLGREEKENLGTAERRGGRTAAQVAANLGVAALVSSPLAQSWLGDTGWFSSRAALAPAVLLAAGLAALAEAAADTVSSEVGIALNLVLGGRPRMITSLRPVEAGTDGAISLAGTLSGVAAAGIVAGVGAWALGGGSLMFWIGSAGAVFGLLFDSFLGATLERRGWLNNDAVNFLAAGGAAGCALALLAAMALSGAG